MEFTTSKNGNSMLQGDIQGSHVKLNEQSISGRHASESSYSHFFEMNKTKNSGSMFETTRNDISISTEIHPAETRGNDEGASDLNQDLEDNTEKTVINTQESPVSNRARSIDIEEASPGLLQDRGLGSDCSTNERHILNRTTNNSKFGSIATSLPHVSSDPNHHEAANMHDRITEEEKESEGQLD